MAYFGRKKELVDRHYELIEEYLNYRVRHNNLKNNSGKDKEEYLVSLGEAIFECLLDKCSYYELNAILNATDNYKHDLGDHYYQKHVSYSSYHFNLPFMPESYEGFNSHKVNERFNELMNISDNRNSGINDYETLKNNAWQAVIDFEENMKEDFKFSKIIEIRNEHIREYEKKYGVKAGMMI